MRYYKDLCKIVIQKKTQIATKVECINEVLFSNVVSKGLETVNLENLINHKKLIKDMIQMINEKRDQIYLLESTKENLEKELRFFIYDYDTIKLIADIRNKLKNLDYNTLIKNVNKTNSHKMLPKECISLIINSERFLEISGQKYYFEDQKMKALMEIERLNNLNITVCGKKKEWKSKYLEKEEELQKTIKKYNMELENFRKKEYKETIEVEIQTEIDESKMNKMVMTYEASVVLIKNSNKMNYYMERIRNGVSKAKTLRKDHLLSLIATLFQEKIDSEFKDVNNNANLNFDIFVNNYFHNKYKISKIVKSHMESMLKSVLENSKLDMRVEVFGKFLGVGETKLRLEIIDSFLIILKYIPISFLKLYIDPLYMSYTMNIDLCLDILNQHFSLFNISKDILIHLLGCTLVYQNEKELNNLKVESKYELFILIRFYKKSTIFISNLLNDYKNNNKISISLSSFFEKIVNANNDLIVNEEMVNEIFFKHFVVTQDKMVDLDSFFAFFSRKQFFFKIKIIDFLEITLKNFIFLFGFLEKKFMLIFDQFNTKKNGLMNIKEFQSCFLTLIGGSEREWNIVVYFNKAINFKEQEYLGKEEFIKFCMNEVLVLKPILKFYNSAEFNANYNQIV